MVSLASQVYLPWVTASLPVPASFLPSCFLPSLPLSSLSSPFPYLLPFFTQEILLNRYHVPGIMLNFGATVLSNIIIALTIVELPSSQM